MLPIEGRLLIDVCLVLFCVVNLFGIALVSVLIFANAREIKYLREKVHQQERERESPHNEDDFATNLSS